MDIAPAIAIFTAVGIVAAWIFWIYYRFVKDCYDRDREERKRHRVTK